MMSSKVEVQLLVFADMAAANSWRVHGFVAMS
jgi:hypothetical protein